MPRPEAVQHLIDWRYFGIHNMEGIWEAEKFASVVGGSLHTEGGSRSGISGCSETCDQLAQGSRAHPGPDTGWSCYYDCNYYYYC